MSGVKANIRPMTPESRPADEAPTTPILSALSMLSAPILVPTIVVIAVPILKTIGISKNSTLEPIPYPAIADVPNCPIRPVSTSTVPTVKIGESDAGNATEKISLNRFFSKVIF